jgi:hypothetical protein
MTKKVRIENADTGTMFKVIVQIWDKVAAEPGLPPPPDVLVREIDLPYPTAMTDEVYLTSSRYIVIKETQ